MRRTVDDLGAAIERRWAQLGSPAPGGDVKVLDLPQDVAAGPLLLGIANDGSRLLVPLASDAHRSFRPDRKSRGVHLLLRELEQNDVRRWYLDVVCLRSEFRWLFSSFVADVLLRFERHPDVDPPAIVTSVYATWRALFAGGGPRMTIKQLAGLYGELHVLERVLRHTPAAVERWRGPLGEPHDFVSPGLDLEVKTTLSSEDDLVHIHGLGQLAAPVDGELRLAHLRVETPSSDGDSLGEMVGRIERKDSGGRFAGLLVAVGYGAEERRAYSEITFRLVSERWYPVDPSFPRLTADIFPGGVVPEGLGDFRYMLDLSCVSVLPLSDGAIEEALMKLSS